MRLVALLLAAAAAPALAATPAATDVGSGPVSTQPLATGEVLLELAAVGTARQRADLANFTLFLVCYGETEAEAGRLMEQHIASIRAAARAFGVRSDEIRVQGTAPFNPSAELLQTDPQGAEATAAGRRHGVRSRMDIRLRAVDRVAQLQDRLRGLGIADTGGPAYSLTDDRAARRRARADALATLRADAEAYGASLGMRVVRLLRVSERLGTDVVSLMLGSGQAAQRVEAARANASGSSEVEVPVFVSADFALGPQ